MYNAPYQGVANELAKYGRYGDSMLVHMNPIEVQMLASLSPTGRLTTNPVTGQQEAFLPFLAPLLGSFLGNAVLGSTLGATAAGALGSAAATTLATGDLEQGIMSGITGFGIGSALGAAGNAATEAAKTATTQAATDAATATTFSPGAAAATMNPLAADTTLRAAIESVPSAFSPGAAGAQMAAAPNFADVVATPPVTPPTSTFTERLAAPVQQPGAFFSALTEPASFLPMYVGETSRMAREQELMGRGSMAEYEAEQKKQRERTLGQIGDVFNRVRSAYPGVGYAQGGMIDSYAVGGGVENSIRRAAELAGYSGAGDAGDLTDYTGYGIPIAKDVQLSLRGSEFVPPPAASYSALDVGGQGYLPGVAPEFQYFREPPPAENTGYVPPPPGTIAGGGGYDIENILRNFGAYQNYLAGQEDTAIRDTAEDLLSRQFAPFQERLGRIESRLEQPMVQEFDYSRIPSYTPPDLSLIEERLAAIESRPIPEFDYSRIPSYTPPDLSGIQERLAAIESRPAPEFDYSRIPSYTPPDLSAINERLAAIESRKVPEFDYSRIPSYTPPDLSGIQQQISALQSGFGALQNRPAPEFDYSRIPTYTPPDLSGIESRISELQSGIGALQSRPQPTFDTSSLEQRLAAIEGRGAPQVSFDPIMERLSALEGMLASQRGGTPSYENPFSQEINSAFDYGFAEGGMTESSDEGMDDNSSIVEMTVAAIRGEVENADQIISRFIDMYGSDVFMQLREQVLQDIVPGAQTNGMVEGEGGGQDDLVEGMIGTQRPVAVSPGEYIIPADVVSLAGGGYSGDGAKFFDGLIDDIRQKTMGTTEQIRPYQRNSQNDAVA